MYFGHSEELSSFVFGLLELFALLPSVNNFFVLGSSENFPDNVQLQSMLADFSGAQHTTFWSSDHFTGMLASQQKKKENRTRLFRVRSVFERKDATFFVDILVLEAHTA